MDERRGGPDVIPGLAGAARGAPSCMVTADTMRPGWMQDRSRVQHRWAGDAALEPVRCRAPYSGGAVAPPASALCSAATTCGEAKTRWQSSCQGMAFIDMAEQTPLHKAPSEPESSMWKTMQPNIR